MKKNWILSALYLALMGCNYTDAVIVGPVTDAIEVEDVAVYYEQLPQCDITTIAHFRAPGEFLTRQGMVSVFRHKASQLGATAIQVVDIQKSGSTNYFGSARAIRCIPENGGD